MIIVAFPLLALLVATNGQFNVQPFGQYDNNANQFYGQSNQLPDQSYPGNQPFDPFGNRMYPNAPGYSGGYYEPVYNPFNRPVQSNYPGSGQDLRCPQHWVQFQQSCYKFIRSPVRNREDARRNCQAFKSDLVSVNSYDEHGFLIYQLLGIDPQHRKWYTSIRQQTPGFWVNDGDGSQLTNMENAFLPGQDTAYGKDFIVYRSVIKYKCSKLLILHWQVHQKSA